MPRHASVAENVTEFREDRFWSGPPEMAKLVYPLNDPTFVPADKATHMREDDYVVAFAYKDVARAYPVWIVDYYHAINDSVGGEPIIVFS